MKVRAEDIVLVFPPHWAFDMPHLALPYLHGALAAAGFGATLLDENVEFHRWLYSAEGVEHLAARVSDEIVRIDNQGDLAAAEVRHLRALSVAAAEARRLRVDIDQAVRVVCCEELYQPRRLAWAFEQLAGSYQLVSRAYAPSRLDFVSFDASHDAATPAGLAALVRDGRTNPYRTYFSRFTIPRIRALCPRLIGISISAETQWVPALTLCSMLRDAGCDAAIVLGGGVPTRLADILVRPEGSLADYCDLIVIGEGEEAIVELATRRAAGELRPRIAGAVHYRFGEVPLATPPRPHVAFRRISPPLFHGLDLRRYFSPTPVLPLMLARGCYHRCAFCDHSAAYGAYRSARHPVDVVREIAEHRQSFGAVAFAFADEAIPAAAARGIAALVAEHVPGIHFAASFRAEPGLEAADWAALAHAGLRLAQFGLESGSQRVLGVMNKGTNIAQMENALTGAAQAGVWNHAFMIVGFPTETALEARESADLLARNRDRVHSYGASRFHLMRHSAVAAATAQFGVEVGAPAIWSLVLPHRTRIGMSVEEADSARAELDRDLLPAFRGSHLWRRLERAQLLLYLANHPRERVLDMGQELADAIARKREPHLPIDIHLARLRHDVTDGSSSVPISQCPVSLLSDSRSGSVSLLTDAAFSVVASWREGQPLAHAARRLAEGAGLAEEAALAECSSLLSQLELAPPTRDRLECDRARPSLPGIGNLRRLVPRGLPVEAYPEWLAVASDLKPGMRTTLYNRSSEQLEQFQTSVERTGLSVRLSSLRPDGLAHLSLAERARALAASPVHAYVARDARTAESLVVAERRGAAEFGKALGYPGCCIAWLNEVDAEHRNRPRPANLPVESRRRTSGSGFAELNNLLWHLADRASPYYLISHYPCSYRCARSLELAISVHGAIARCDGEFAEQVITLLSCPVLLWDDSELLASDWDENKGVCLAGGVTGGRVSLDGYLSLRRQRDYSALGLDFADELVVHSDRVVARRGGRTAGCWWAREQGTPYLFEFRWHSRGRTSA